LIPGRFYPVCTGGQRPAPPEHIHEAWTYLELLDEHRYPSWDAIRMLADAAQVVLDAPAHVSIREALGDLAQFRAVCSSSILAETPGYAASFSSPLLATRRV
jgi:hypothetical protein